MASRGFGSRRGWIALALVLGVAGVLLGAALQPQPRGQLVASAFAAKGTATDREPARDAAGWAELERASARRKPALEAPPETRAETYDRVRVEAHVAPQKLRPEDLEVFWREAADRGGPDAALGVPPQLAALPPDLAPGAREAARQTQAPERLRWAAQQADRVDETVEETDGGLADDRLAELAHDVRYTGADETLLRAIHELGLQRDERVVDALVDASWRPEAQARSDAVVALWRLAADGAEGPLGAEVADALERASRDGDPGVAARARSALEDLDALRAPPEAPAEPDASGPACPPEICAS